MTCGDKVGSVFVQLGGTWFLGILRTVWAASHVEGLAIKNV